MEKKKPNLFQKIFDFRLFLLDFGKWTSALFVWIWLRTKKIFIHDKKPKGLTRGRFIIASNHVSLADHFVIYSTVASRRICFVSTTNLTNGKWGWFFKAAGTIGMDKDHLSTKAFKEVNRMLDYGHVVCMFPEGTIKEKESELDFKAGVIMMSAISKADILPVYLVKRTGLQRKIAVIGDRIKYQDLFKGKIPTKEEISNANALLIEKEKELEKKYQDKYLNKIAGEWKLIDLYPGAHIRVKVKNYYHHGIYIGNGEVVQFGHPFNVSEKPENVKVIRSPIEDFAGPATFIEVYQYSKKELKIKNKDEDIIKKALSSLGEGGYNVLNNNCEHFANRCIFNNSRSSQTDDLVK